MIRHYNLCPVRYQYIRLRYSYINQRLNFLCEILDTQCNTVAYNISDFCIENTRRQLMKCKFSVMVDDCVTCIAAALKSYYHIGILCKHICNFAFALVAPVCSNDCFNHEIYPPNLTQCAMRSEECGITFLYNSLHIANC